MMKQLTLPLCVLLLFGYGCVESIPAPPHTVAEFTKIQRTHPQQYAKSTVMQHNIQRVLDPDLPAAERESSLDLISSLVGPGGELPVEVSAVLLQKDCPPTLRQKVLGTEIGVASVNRNGGMSTSPAIGVAKPSNGSSTAGASSTTTAQPLPLSQLAQATAGPRRRATLRQLIQSPRPEVLPDICKAWAKDSPSGSDEQLFRQAVAKAGSGRWQDVLLNALNAKRFAARGSALIVLSGRGAEIDLLSRVKAMTAQTVSVQAMKTFADKFGYVPANGGQLLACVIVRSAHSGSVDAPARLAADWSAKYNYKFNIRDFHLLNKLASDPQRNRVTRDELTRQLVTTLALRKHADRRNATFSKQAASLTVPDLWNIMLLDEMLQRPRVSLALRILADRLRAGLSSPRSGLVFYEGGKAAAKLYPQAMDSTRGDRDHVPERELQQAGFRAMCHLHTRFEKVYNGDRAAASIREISAARQVNFYGLLLTSVDSGTFNATYYNPDGRAVSLGIYAFRK